jgi:hypothetical protein
MAIELPTTTDESLIPTEPGVEASELCVKENYRLDCSPSGLSVSVENLRSIDEPYNDPESGETTHFLFNVVTTNSDEGVLKLARIVSQCQSAGVATHTFDARSGAAYRITRLGATDSRLLQYASSFDFMRDLNADIVKEECSKKGITIENPKTAEGRSWYDPYEKLCGAFELEAEKMYMPLNDRERISFFRVLVSGDSHFDGSAKGCGLDIPELESTKADNAFCLAVFPSHDEPAKEVLAKKWMPLDFPWKLPIDDIKDYFGEVGFLLLQCTLISDSTLFSFLLTDRKSDSILDFLDI